MRPRRDPIPRAKEAWWWLGGFLTLGFVGGAVVVAGIALWEHIDIRQLTPGLAEPPPELPQPSAPTFARSPRPFDAVLFTSEANRSYFDDPTYYPAEISRWRSLATRVGGSVRDASSADELSELSPRDVLFLPEAPCVSSGELAAIGAHLTRGGHLVANWATGVRDEACEWRGWSTLLDITGAEDVREITNRDGSFVTVPGGLATSPGLDPGTRIELRPDPAIALRMPGEKVYWSDWALNPVADDDGAGADVAVATVRSPEGGRITWFGLRTRQAATPVDSVRLDLLLENGIAWAAGVPSAMAGAWPGGAQAAVTFALDVEGGDSYVNARDAAAVFELEELPITFFVVSELVRDDDALAEALRAAGEVGTQTIDHAPLIGLTRQEQSMRLRRSWDDVERWVGVGPSGLRPPEEAFDSVTLSAWRNAGGTYVLAANEARSASPEVHATSEGPVVLLPRLVKDDYSVIVRDVTLRSQRLADAFLAGTRKVRAIGGLAVVAGHTQIISSGPRLDAIRTVADSVRGQTGWWLASSGDIAGWWLERAAVQLTWQDAETDAGAGSSSAPHLVVSLLDEADGGVDGLWIDVTAPSLDESWIPLVDGRSVEFAPEPWGMRVNVGSIAPGAEKHITFARSPGAADAGGAGAD